MKLLYHAVCMNVGFYYTNGKGGGTVATKKEGDEKTLKLHFPFPPSA